jgi:hypothetical protein
MKPTRRTLSLRECVCKQDASKPLEVDESACVVKGVKLLGFVSLNGRRYLPEAVRKKIAAYEGVVVNIDHDDKSRRFADRFARVRGVLLMPDGAYGDIHYNPKHPLAETFAWWAKNDPSAIGMSHNATGRGEEDSMGTFVVDEILDVYSVDVVADPATTKGLFESHNPMKKTLYAKLKEQLSKSKSKHKASLLKIVEDDLASMDDGAADSPDVGDAGSWKEDILAAISKLLDSDEIHADDSVSKLMTLLRKAKGKVEEDDEEPSDDTNAQDDGNGDTMQDSVQQLKAELDAYKLKEARRQKVTEAKKLCDAARLPKDAITKEFIEALVACKSTAKKQRLIDDRRKILSKSTPRKPTSAGRDGQADVTFDTFVEGLKEFTSQD